VALHALLSRVMIRSVKAEMEKLGEIPRCTVSTTKIELSNKERRAYNGLVTIIKRNILLSESGGSTIDSLLHQKNRKYAHEAISNARKACCVSGQLRIEIMASHLRECLADMRRGHSLHKEGCECNGFYFDMNTLKELQFKARSGECPLLADTTGVVPEDRVLHVQRAFVGVGSNAGDTARVDEGRCACDVCEQQVLPRNTIPPLRCFTFRSHPFPRTK